MAQDKEVEDLEAIEDEEGEQGPQTEQVTVDPDKFYAESAFRVVYQTNNFLLPQIRELVAGKQVINIRPEYQRRLRWTTPQKSRLIESLLLNIPIPSVFFFEGEAARYEVMDGQQRLNAIKEFMANEFRLSSLEVLKPLNGLRYSDCPPRIKRGLDRAVVTATVLLLESDVSIPKERLAREVNIRREIFERLNTGGTRLNKQELRNAIYPGRFNDLIIELTRDPLFTKIWDIPPYTETEDKEFYENPKRRKNSLYATMTDCQIVLRFFALRDESNIRGSMKGILDRCMEARVDFSEEEFVQEKKAYLERLRASDEIFAGSPFCLPPDAKKKVRLSVALHDAVMIAIDRQWRHLANFKHNAAQIRSAVEAALKNPETLPVLVGKGNTAESIRERIEFIETLFLSNANR